VTEVPIPVGGERPVDSAAAGHLLAQAFTDGGRQRVDLIAWQDGSFTVTLIDLPTASVRTSPPAPPGDTSDSPPVDAARATTWPARDAEDGVRRMMDFTRRRAMPQD
jgi:hypothetical protein